MALGCGGENQLLLTDQDEMLELMQTNIRLNQVDSRAQALILNWYVGPFLPCWFGFVLGEERGGFIVPLPHPQPHYVSCNVLVLLANMLLACSCCRGEPLPREVVTQKPNVIIAAECVYFEPAFPLLLDTLKDLLALNEEAVVYFCFKKRRRADMQFVKMAKKAFLVEELFDEDRPVFQRQSLFLFSFKCRPSAKSTAVRGNAGKNSNGVNGINEWH